VKRETKRLISEMVREVDMLSQVHSCAALNLLRYCINNRVSYLHRILGDRPDLLPFFQDFDTTIDETLMKILQAPNSADTLRQVSIIRSMPQARGGLGIHCHTGPVGIKGNILHRQATRDFIDKYFKKSSPFVKVASKWEPISIQYCGLVPEHLVATGKIVPPSPYLDPEAATPPEPPDPAALRHEESTGWDLSYLQTELQKVVSNIHSQLPQDLAWKLRNEGNTSQCATFLSFQFRGSGRWLSGTGYNPNSFMFTHEQFKDLLRYRCLLHPVLGGQAPIDAPLLRRCRCCAEGEYVDFAKHPTHMLHCRTMLQAHFIRTHQQVCNELVRIIKSCKPEWTVSKEVIFRRGAAVTREEDRVTAGVTVDGTVVAQTTGPEAEAGPDDSSATKLMADIVFVTDTNDEYLVDVTIAAPCAPSYLHGTPSSCDTTGVTARRRAHEKAIKYVQVVPHKVSDGLFIPFAMEASGLLSVEARGLVTMLTTTTENRNRNENTNTPVAIAEGKANKIVDRLTRLVIKWNAHKMAYARKCFNRVPHQVMRYTNANLILSNSFPA
jgi:hypothetical protein